MNAPPPQPAAGLEALFFQMRPALERRARGMGAGVDAEDVLQDVWLRLKSVKAPVANPAAYLHRMVYTVVLDHRRSAVRSRGRESEWLAEAAGNGEPVPADAERALIAREALDAIEARLARVGEPATTIFWRHKLERQTQPQIATDLGLGLSTVEKHLRRALAAVLEGRDEA